MSSCDFYYHLTSNITQLQPLRKFAVTLRGSQSAVLHNQGIGEDHHRGLDNYASKNLICLCIRFRGRIMTVLIFLSLTCVQTFTKIYWDFFHFTNLVSHYCIIHSQLSGVIECPETRNQRVLFIIFTVAQIPLLEILLSPQLWIMWTGPTGPATNLGGGQLWIQKIMLFLRSTDKVKFTKFKMTL